MYIVLSSENYLVNSFGKQEGQSYLYEPKSNPNYNDKKLETGLGLNGVIYMYKSLLDIAKKSWTISNFEMNSTITLVVKRKFSQKIF